MKLTKLIPAIGIMVIVMSSTMQSVLAVPHYVYEDISDWTSYLSYVDENWQDDDGNTVPPTDSVCEITREEKYSGNAALHYRLEVGKSSFFCRTNQTVRNLKKDQKYYISAMVKTTSYQNGMAITTDGASSANNGFDGLNFTIGDVSATGYDWRKIDMQFTYTGRDDGYITFSIIQNWAYQGGSELWVDDLMLCEIDENGNYGANMFKNPGFEDGLDLTPPNEVANITYTLVDSGVKLYWDAPMNEDFAGVTIYKLDGEEKEFLCYSEGLSAEVTGLANGQKHTLLICATDADGNKTDGIKLNVTPVADAFKIKTPTITLNDATFTHWGSGTLKAVVELQNNEMPDDYGVELVLVIYKNGCLWDAVTKHTVVPVAKNYDEYVSVMTEIPVDSGEEYSAELFIWNSASGLQALDENFIIR